MTTRKSQIVCSVGEAARALADEYAEKNGITLTETVRRALMLLSLVDSGQVRLFTADGETQAEVFLL